MDHHAGQICPPRDDEKEDVIARRFIAAAIQSKTQQLIQKNKQNTCNVNNKILGYNIQELRKENE